jgi:hypothetical protein
MRSLYPWPLFPPDVDSKATRSLSLQLSIQEWINSFRWIEEVEKRPSELQIIADGLQKLLLYSLESPFSVKPGTFDKLSFYLHKLQNASTSPINFAETLLDDMRTNILSFLGQIHGWKKALSTPSELLEHVRKLCHLLRSKLLEFFDALFPFFDEARSDENVLFYLIERQKEMNQILQNETSFTPRFKNIEHLFCHLYPTGPAHLRMILLDGYTRRGFSEFYAQHKTLIESIEWLVEPCSTQMSIPRAIQKLEDAKEAPRF